MNTWKQTITRLIAVSFGLVIFSLPNFVLNVQAQPTHTSPNYGVDEVFFGSGGVNDANSANYNARASLGDLGVGNSASANFQAYGGFTTDATPFIEFVVNTSSVDFGVIQTGTSHTGTATFTIRTWLASGYNVTTASDAPSNGGYIMNNLATQTAPDANAEQFGINLVANTVPSNVGSDPVQLPDATFSYGQAAAGYNTPNVYQYNKGDIVAQSNQSTSITQYTITYLFNISAITYGGTYVMNHVLVATSTY